MVSRSVSILIQIAARAFWISDFNSAAISARRLLLDVGSQISMWLGVQNLVIETCWISDFNAARRLLLDVGSQISMQLGVGT